MSLGPLIATYQRRKQNENVPSRVQARKDLLMAAATREIALFVCRTPETFSRWLSFVQSTPDVAALVTDEMIEANRWRSTKKRKGAYNPADDR